MFRCINWWKKLQGALEENYHIHMQCGLITFDFALSCVLINNHSNTSSFMECFQNLPKATYWIYSWSGLLLSALLHQLWFYSFSSSWQPKTDRTDCLENKDCPFHVVQLSFVTDCRELAEKSAGTGSDALLFSTVERKETKMLTLEFSVRGKEQASAKSLSCIHSIHNNRS